MPKYEFTRNAGLFKGKRRCKGDTITLTKTEAKYMLPPHDNLLKPAKQGAQQEAEPEQTGSEPQT